MKKRDLYFSVYSFMVDELKLSGNNLLVYALIYSYCCNTNEERYFGSQSYLSERLGMSRQTVNKCLGYLCRNNMIEKKYVNRGGMNCLVYRSKPLNNMSKVFTESVNKSDSVLSTGLTQACQEDLHNNKGDNKVYNKAYIYNNIRI